MSTKPPAPAVTWGLAPSFETLTEPCLSICRKERREQSKPAVVEIKTYRYRGHSVADPDRTYRDKSEIEEYQRTKDPINVYRTSLIADKIFDDAAAEQIDTEARAEADVAADFAEASPFPTPDDIQKDVYWETDNPSQRTSSGRLFFT